MNKINKQITEIIENRQNAALCIITDTKGSTPRKKGSKMLVYEDGTIVGTIGGGEMEFALIEQAKNIIKNQVAESFSFGLKADFEMACGGKITIYIEPIKLPNKLIIFGGGHIGSKLAEWAIDFNFEVTIVDERKNIFDNLDKNKFQLLNQDYQTAIKNLTFDTDTFVCIITHQHAYDRQIAALCAPHDLAFIGVIASKNKVQKISKLLSKEDKLLPKDIEKINMPMGMPINCETPEEIAISILGKLIDVKNKKTRTRNL